MIKCRSDSSSKSTMGECFSCLQCNCRAIACFQCLPVWDATYHLTYCMLKCWQVFVDWVRMYSVEVVVFAWKSTIVRQSSRFPQTRPPRLVYPHAHTERNTRYTTWEEKFPPKAPISLGFKARSLTLCCSACFVKETVLHVSAVLLQRSCLMVQLQKMAKRAIHPVCFLSKASD